MTSYTLKSVYARWTASYTVGVVCSQLVNEFTYICRQWCIVIVN